MSLLIHQVDAFTSEPFRGNPAAVTILPEARDADWMQSLAREMNLSETAFLVRRADGAFDLRWFTPAIEVELCGHATVASAHVLYETGVIGPEETARFQTQSGELTARRVEGRIELDFPGTPPTEKPPVDGLFASLGIDSARFVGMTRYDWFVDVGDESSVRALSPDFGGLKALNVRGVICAAPADREEGASDVDFVSRFFAPGSGIDEDPVTGSAHCALAPYFADRLEKNPLTGVQASARGGVVGVEVAGDRVRLRGDAVTILRAELLV